MAAPPAPPASVIGQALVDFSTRGLFPTADDVATAELRPAVLPDAIRVLADAKAGLEAAIQSIVSETAEDVRAWIDNAQALQVAMARRKTLASDILVRTRADAADGLPGNAPAPTPAEAAAEAHARFLTGELSYNLQVRYLLEALRRVGRLLDEVAAAAGERRVLDALRLLERAWAALDAMPVSRSCRALQLLDRRAFDLKADVHGVLDRVWGALVQVRAGDGDGDDDDNNATLAIHATRPDEPVSLADAVIGLQAYKEVDRRMAELWRALDQAIVTPRTDRARPARPRLCVHGHVLGVRARLPTDDDDDDDAGVNALLADLETMAAFLAQRLPAGLVPSLSAAMMPDLVARLTDVWLAAVVPTSLEQMAAFETTLAAAQDLCTRLAELQYTGFGRLQEWIESAPRVWLAKRREAALDAVRTGVARGLGAPQTVEKVEKQMVSRSEGRQLAAAPAVAAAATTEQAADWNTAWSDEEEEPQPPAQKAKEAPEEDAAAADDGADEWGAWGDDDGDEHGAEPEENADEKAGEEPQPKASEESTNDDADDDDDDAAAADAWGWGDEDNEDDAGQPPPEAAKPAAPKKAEAATRELVLRETYAISSMPGPVLALITAVLEDAAALTSGAYQGSAVAAAAAGLFGLPALVLAMFRAVAPPVYARAVGGNMYLYNDALYLAEQLAAVAAAWTARLPPASASMLRLDAEGAKLQAFAARAYGREMAVQKTVLRDLLGGDQNVLQGSIDNKHHLPQHGSGGSADEDADDYVDAAVARVRSMAAAWEGVLAPSAWSQAVGALADAAAAKLILDVLDMPSISQDEAFALARLIQKVTELDDLFRAPAEDDAEADDDAEAAASLPMTAQYAPNWLRLQYLSEVLQSNLREVRYLWMESELSLYFAADEVVDLLRLSFEDNARSREVAREIAANPHPMMT